MQDKRIDLDGDYLLIAPDVEKGFDYHHMLSERAYLADNITSFLSQHSDITLHQITIYELREINEEVG